MRVGELRDPRWNPQPGDATYGNRTEYRITARGPYTVHFVGYCEGHEPEVRIMSIEAWRDNAKDDEVLNVQS